MVFGLGRKKSSTTIQAVFPDNDAFVHEHPTQQGALALPMNVEEVVRATHTGVPRQLPGEDASQDEVRYFLYQILTLKEYRISIAHPQWVLETCMCWSGDGSKLRSLPLDAFQRLCPLAPGYADIDWRVKGSKFTRQSIPPCDVRIGIGNIIKHVVTGLKAKELGNQRPGWTVSNDSRVSTKVKPDNMGTPQGFAPEPEHRSPMSHYAAPPACAAPYPFYSSSNQSLPLLHQTPIYGGQQPPMHMQQQMSVAGSQYGLPAISMIHQTHQTLSPASSARPESDDRSYNARSPPGSPPDSSISSYCQTESISSHISESTGQTSLPGSENEMSFWDYETNQARPLAASMQPVADGGCISPGMYQVPAQRTSSGIPSRYKTRASPSATQMNGHSYDPKLHMANLRSESYNVTPTNYSPSEASLTPSDSVTNKYSPRRNSILPQDKLHPSLRRHSSSNLIALSNASSSSTMQSYGTAMNQARSAIEPLMRGSEMPQLGSAVPVIRSSTTGGRPLNNYKVDAHAFDSAEHVSLKSRPSAVRSQIAEASRSRKIGRCRSEGGFSQRMNSFFQTVRGDEEPVGPSIRFQNPRTGQPRLTVYETIEEKERLEKMKSRSPGRLNTWRERGLTVYETIEEREILDGKPQRGVDTSVDDGWRRYF